MNSKTRTLCEAAMLIALAQILSYINFSRMPDGGSITFAMVPIVLFGVRHGVGWASLTGFVLSFSTAKRIAYDSLPDVRCGRGVESIRQILLHSRWTADV